MQTHGNRTGEQKTSRVQPRNVIDGSDLVSCGQPSHDRIETLGVREDRGEVTELDAGGGKVLYAAHQTFNS
ncbi:hypothetical protein GCM10022294_14500 [Dietzia aurantiaca]